MLKGSFIPHLKGTINNIRASSSSLEKSLTDITDNPLGKSSKIYIDLHTVKDKNNDVDILNKIIISDNKINGFEHINEKGISNPFNLTHERIGHNNDDETSEFGTGLKQSAIYNGNILTVFTKNENICYKVIMNFEEMKKCELPEDSYKPNFYGTIPMEEYTNHHGFENGSTIIIDNLIRNEIINEQKINNLIYTFRETYGKLINDDFNISLNIHNNNGKKEYKITPLNNILDNPICKKRAFYTTLYVNKNNSEDIIIKIKNPNESYDIFIYKFLTRKFISKIRKGEEDIYLNKIKYNLDDYDIIDIISTSTYESNFLYDDTNINENDTKDELKYNNIIMFRNGRSHGTCNFKGLIRKNKTNNDGWENHIISELYWKTKRLNKSMGVQSNKDINENNNNPLTKCIAEIQILMGKYLNKKVMPEFINKNKVVETITTEETPNV